MRMFNANQLPKIRSQSSKLILTNFIFREKYYDMLSSWCVLISFKDYFLNNRPKIFASWYRLYALPSF